MPEFSVPTQLPDWIKDHVALYLKSEGKEGQMWDSSIAGGPGPIATLLLATSGRSSGRRRRSLVHPYGGSGASRSRPASRAPSL